MLVGILDLDPYEITLFEAVGIAEVDFAIDLGRIGLRTTGGAAFAVGNIYDHVDGAADLRVELGSGDGGGLFHDPGVALFLDLVGYSAGQVVGSGAGDGFEAERTDPV